MAVTPTLSVPTTDLAFLVMKAREFDAEVPPSGLEDGSDAPDDKVVGVLESTSDNPTEEELRAALTRLNEDQLAEVMTLVWIGRGDYDADDWKGAVRDARGALNKRTIEYLLRTPNLA